VKNEVVVRGEAVISYEDFEKINAGIEDVDAKYKNPRNLCSGSVRQLNNKITAERNVRFYAFSLASGAELEFRHEEMEWLSSLGFQTVEYIKVTADSLAQGVAEFERKISNFTIPSDGLVLIYDDIEYGKSLGRTAKFPRDSIAFKWRDELKSTHLTEIIWNVSRTGLINPIAVFEPVELEGTTVSRASVHNLSIVKELGLGVADEIMVYKANMIIPQIAENLTKSGTAQPPEVCPVCGEPTTIKADNGVETLHCQNSECPAKRIKSFTHFVSRNALNIDGLSEATLEKFVDEAIVTEFVDIFRLEKHSERIISMEGFGEKSFANLIAAIEKASHTTPARFLYSLGVPNIGSANAKVICQACQNKWEKVAGLTALELTEIEGIGDIMAQGFVDFFGDKDNQAMIEDLLTEITLDESYEESRGGSLDGLTFVVTGKVEQFDNRDQVKEAVAAAGGKVASSVSAKTDYLINNDINSSSSKNKKAKELGVPIITEAEFIEMLGEEIQEAN
jgi:DNA ligase (NAD+)